MGKYVIDDSLSFTRNGNHVTSVSDSGTSPYVGDFGARLYDPSIGRWLSQDPMAEKYYPHSPYLFCAGNPMKFVDPEGKAWTPKYDMLYDGRIIGYTWVDERDSYYENGQLKKGLYHQAIFFSENGTFNNENKHNIGSSTAYVYLNDGTIQTFKASTRPSDNSRYPTIPEGLYESSVGKHKGSYDALKMYDVGKSLNNNTIELGFKNPAFSDGRTFAAGINIHRAGINNLTGMTKSQGPVSAGCMLIDISMWDTFSSALITSNQSNILPGRTKLARNSKGDAFVSIPQR